MDGVILLADKNSSAWDFAEKIQKYLKENRDVEIPLQEISIGHFRNGEISMHVPENVRKKEVYFIHDSSKNPQEWWVELLLLKDLLLSGSAESVNLVLPDLLYSRQDRKDQPHVPISARALAESISTDLKRIITMDLHAPQLQGFYKAGIPLDNLYSFPESVRYIKKFHSEDLKNLAVVSPDAGGADRTRAFLQKLIRADKEEGMVREYSFALINKIRPKPGEVGEMNLIGEVSGKNVLIIDDILDSGGTSIKAANLLRQKGAKKVLFYATHGIFSCGTEELCKNFDAIMISNTHYHSPEKIKGVEVVDVSSVFAEAIYRAEKGLSISKLFE